MPGSLRTVNYTGFKTRRGTYVVARILFDLFLSPRYRSSKCWVDLPCSLRYVYVCVCMCMYVFLYLPLSRVLIIFQKGLWGCYVSRNPIASCVPPSSPNIPLKNLRSQKRKGKRKSYKFASTHFFLFK